MSQNEDHHYRVLGIIAGREMVFNYDRFRSIWDGLQTKRGEKTRIRDIILSRINRDCNSDKELSIDAFNGWVRGKYGPSHITYVHIIEEALNLRQNDLLMEKNYNSDNWENMNMREINEYERNAARLLYARMCDLISLAECLPEYSDPIVMKYQHRSSLSSDKDRFALEDDIRKARFDVPQRLCSILLQIVDEIYGEELYGDPTNMYYSSNDYRNYLKKNDLHDNDDARYAYSAVFVQRMREKLEEAFKEYFVK